MINLSTRTKQAVKIGLSVVIAMGIALSMDWEKPYWAGFAVAMISLDTNGKSLNKGAMRMLGTLVGIMFAWMFIDWFGQQRFAFMAMLSLYVGFCTYMMMGKKHQYFWFVSGFVCMIIAVDSSNSATPFQISVERFLETGMGILVYSLVNALLWPRGSRGALEDASRRLSRAQGQLYRAYRRLMCGEGSSLKDSRQWRIQELPLLQQVEQLLNAAESDSYEVWEMRHQWRRFIDLSTTLTKALEHWRTSLADIETLDLPTLLPGLDALLSELDLRFAQIDRMLSGQAPERIPQAVTLAVDKAEMRALTHFQLAAVMMAKHQIDRIETLSQSLFDCIQDQRGVGGPASKPLPETTRRRRLAIDLDRLRGVTSVLATLWIGFFIWIYVDPPGHSAFMQMATLMAMIIVMSGTSPTGMALQNIAGTLFAGILYVFVMPHLSSYVELGLMIFAGIFAISYLLSEPQQAGAKSAVMAMFIQSLSVQNEQTYSFASYANSLTMTILMGALFIATAYIPTSPQPEKIFLRLYRRFCRHAEFQISELAPAEKQKRGIARHWKAIFYQSDLLELPVKLAACGQKIDYRSFPANTPEQVQGLVLSLYDLAYGIKDLAEAGDYPQAERVKKYLSDDLRAWQRVIETRLQQRADHPAHSIDTSAELRKRLATRLDRLETRIEEIFAQSGKYELSSAGSEGLYRLLGSYRHLSDAEIGSSQLADGINWAQWQEARF